ncbi:hypothetical protein KIN20_037350 [Parelaphostrongylus tenuis]|uniref:Uncharacterized protein n=1 Tax=Parelaphostrongylus tenuis TaxID=148309 RepID=A0AAD5RHV2_PARTN|nr:hypothetical protein KIN20_037350 [Parelaphostrongylus tenuis]
MHEQLEKNLPLVQRYHQQYSGYIMHHRLFVSTCRMRMNVAVRECRRDRKDE